MDERVRRYNHVIPAFSRGGQDTAMDKNRKEGTRHEATGAIKEGTGKVTGDRSKEAEGNLEKNVGKIQRKIGEASDDARNTDRDRH